MVPYDEPIYGFSGELVSTHDYIDLHTMFRKRTQTKTIPIRFLIVNAPTSYNVLLGRPSLNTLSVVVSTPHLAMKFPSPFGDILTVHSDQRLARKCYMASLCPQLPIQQTNHIKRPPSSGITLSGEDLDPRVGRDIRLEPVEETAPIELPNGHSINLGTTLNSDEHAIITPTPSNIVLVKKANGKWRICVDYTNLNKACPRDAYPLPNIDRLVDDATGNKVLSFLDAYSGYNQIPTTASDMNKTAFITDDANYFYRVMPFGLKNAGATYQRLMTRFSVI